MNIFAQHFKRFILEGLFAQSIPLRLQRSLAMEILPSALTISPFFVALRFLDGPTHTRPDATHRTA